MRTAKYIKRLLFKEWLPLIAVFLIVAVLTAVIAASSHSFYDGGTFETAAMTWPSSIFAIVMPFFVYSYRFTRIGGDTYYQLPFKEKQFKNIRVLTGLVAVLAVFVVAFLIGFTMYTILYYQAPMTKDFGYDYTLEKAIINPPVALLAFVSFLVLCSGVYFVTCAAVSLTNKLPSAMIFTAVVHCLLGFTVVAFTAYISEFSTAGSSLLSDVGLASMFAAPNFLGMNLLPMQFGYGTMFCPETDNYSLFDTITIQLSRSQNSPVLGTLIGMGIFDILVFGGATYLTLFSDEPSGEYNGVNGTRNKYLNFVIYATSILMALGTTSLLRSSIFVYALLVVLYIAGLYVTTSIFLGTFKVGRYHAIFIAGSGFLMILTPIVTSIIDFALWSTGH